MLEYLENLILHNIGLFDIAPCILSASMLTQILSRLRGGEPISATHCRCKILLSRLRGGEQCIAYTAYPFQLLSRLRGGEPNIMNSIDIEYLLSRLRGGEHGVRQTC